jgi:hypothetical protein
MCKTGYLVLALFPSNSQFSISAHLLWHMPINIQDPKLHKNAKHLIMNREKHKT